MGRLVVNNAITVNGAFEAPQPPPDGWLVLDADSNQVTLDQLLVADAMVLGRKTYQGLAAVWPTPSPGPASWPTPSPTWAWSTSTGSGSARPCGRAGRGSSTGSGRSPWS